MYQFDPTCPTDEAEFDQLVFDITTRFESGESPLLTDYQARHPRLADRLEKLWPTLEAVAGLGHFSAVNARASKAPPHGRLGEFEILREVGRGGMGVVYEAKQTSLSRRVALKVLPFAAMLDNRQLQRFKNEAQVAACLSHQNIVPVYAVGSERGVHFYAMQFIEGRTLADLIPNESAGARVTRFSMQAANIPSSAGEGARNAVRDADKWDDRVAQVDTRAQADQSTVEERKSRTLNYIRSVVQLAVQGADALQYAHGEGVIHRDVKPSNLLLDDRGRLWVADFGLAMIASQNSLTMTGDLLGTLRYMSPEQAAGNRDLLDHRTDIYSLGITVYEMLTGRPAFPDSDRQRLLRSIIEREPVAPRSLNRAIPRALETIVLKAICKEPSYRYATMGDFRDDMQRFLSDQPIRARLPSWHARCARWCGKNPLAVALTVSLLLVAGAVTHIVTSRHAVVLPHSESLTMSPIAVDTDVGDVSANGEFLAFTNWNTGNLAVLDLAHGTHRDGTTDGNWDGPEPEQQYAERCVWSPDNRLLAYQWIANKVHEIRVIQQDGAQQQTLVRKDSIRYLEPRSWSADGRDILVLQQQYDGTQKLLLINRFNGAEKILHTISEPLATGLRLSPSGRFVVYGWSPKNDSLQDLYLLDTQTNEVIRIVEHPANDSHPAWTADGRWIVFLSNRRGAEGLWAVRIENGRPQGEPQLCCELVGTILPLGPRRDGKYYFRKKDLDSDLYMTEIDFDTGAVTNEVSRITTRYQGTTSAASFSPDGTRLAWLSRIASPRHAGVLLVRDLETGAADEIPLRHARLARVPATLHWMPDNRSIIVCSPTMRRGTTTACFRVDLESREITEILSDLPLHMTNHIAVSSDAKYLYFVESKSKRGTDQGRIVRLDLESSQQVALQSPSPFAVIRNLALSPDSSSLVYSTARKLGVIATDGGHEQLIHELSKSHTFAHRTLDWGSDGKSMIIGTKLNGSDSTSLWQFFLDQRQPREVGIAMREITSLDVIPHGPRVIFASSGSRRLQTLWTIDNLTAHLSTLE